MADGSIDMPWFPVYVTRPLEHGLKIPEAFLRSNRERIGENALLVDRYGGACVVKTERSGRTRRLTDLRELELKFTVRPGDSILFRLGGFSLFLIHVFDAAGIEVLGPRPPAN